MNTKGIVNILGIVIQCPIVLVAIFHSHFLAVNLKEIICVLSAFFFQAGIILDFRIITAYFLLKSSRNEFSYLPDIVLFDQPEVECSFLYV